MGNAFDQGLVVTHLSGVTISHRVLMIETVHVESPLGRPMDGACLGVGFAMGYRDVLAILSFLGLVFDLNDKPKLQLKVFP